MSPLRIAARSAGALAALLLPLALGCSTDDEIPQCDHCEEWTQLASGLGRFPDPHPSSSGYLLFSTVEKTPGAPDADRTADEDIWLLHDATSTRWQLTDDALGAGDNFGARWSPSGTQVAFVHTTTAGEFDIWRMPVTLPGSPSGMPVVGAAELIVADARDPAWASETSLVFVRGDKLYSLSLPAGPGSPTSAAVQLSFDPPLFASTDTFVDRHPMFAPDGGAVFNTIGRENVASVFLKAYEVDDSVAPPDTTETSAWVSFRGPSAENPSYPLFQGVDTLRTPALLQSLPVGAGGVFDVGVRRDSRFLPVDPAPESYCDTTIVQNVDLQPGDIDTVSYYFHVVRGTLLIRSGIAGTTIFWTRKDARETIADYTNDFFLGNLGETARFECLMPYAIGPGDVVNTAVQETLVVVGANQTLADTARVVIDPGRTTTVDLFPVGTVSGTLAFSDNPAVKPQAAVQVLLPGGGLIAAATSDTSGAFLVRRVPAGTFDVFVNGPPGYADTTITGVTVVPPADRPLGTVTLTADGSGPAAGGIAAAAAAREPSERSGRMTIHRPPVPSGSPGANAAALASAFRAEGDLTTVWRLDIDPAGLRAPRFTEMFGSPAQIQSPALTRDLGGGVRYVAYISDEPGEWTLYVQRLVNWQADGAPVLIETPGSSDNLACSRNVFHPRWIQPETSGGLRLAVAMSDCPDNGFEELGFDDDPWAIGEIRLWEVELPADF